MSDLISREALLEAIKGVEVSWYLDRGYTNYDDTTIMDIIEEQPPVEAVPVVHGEWRHIGGDEWCCSECGNVISTEGSWEKPTGKFCEECGADMRKKVAE